MLEATILAQSFSQQALVGDGAPMSGRDHFIAERWDNFRALARSWLHEARANALPELPPLTADQRRVINHSVLRPPRVLPPGRSMLAHAAR